MKLTSSKPKEAQVDLATKQDVAALKKAIGQRFDRVENRLDTLEEHLGTIAQNMRLLITIAVKQNEDADEPKIDSSDRKT